MLKQEQQATFDSLQPSKFPNELPKLWPNWPHLLHLAFPPVQLGTGDGRVVFHHLPLRHPSPLYILLAADSAAWSQQGSKVRHVAWQETLGFPREKQDRLIFPNLFVSHSSYFQKATAPRSLIKRHKLCFGLQLYTMIQWQFVHRSV